MNTMDFIKHDETPLFLVAHLTAVSTKIEAPEVLTDVALLCRNKISPQKGEIIKTNGLQLFSI